MKAMLEKIRILIEDQQGSGVAQDAEEPGGKHAPAGWMPLGLANCIVKHRLGPTWLSKYKEAG